MEINLPRLYSNVNSLMPVQYYDYDTYQISYGEIDDYQIIKKEGRGKYSEVFSGINSHTKQNVIIKVLKPVKKKKIKRQIKILKCLKGHPNIVQLLDIVKDPASKAPCLIFQHVDNVDFKSLFPSLTDLDMRFYMYQLLKALDFCHSKGIMHRDVKPQNIIVDPKNKVFKLIDWGLAEYYHPNNNYNVRVASRYFKGPELLVNNQYYDYSLDIWSAGAMFASMIFRKEPFFMGNDNNDQLIKIAKVLGTEDLMAYIRKYSLSLDLEISNQLQNFPKKPWRKFVNEDNEHLCSDEAIHLLDRMLVYDHIQRILPKQALQHPYFGPVRRK